MNTQMSKKEKIILGSLGLVFLIVFFGMIWDLYGRSLWEKYNSKSNLEQNQVIENGSTSPTNAKPVNGNKKEVGNNKGATKPTSEVSYDLYSKCLENTKEDKTCKDCCDCLGEDVAVVKACRDSCPIYDYSKNTVFKEFEISSKLGPSGNYSSCTASGNIQECKQCCDTPNNFACGDAKYCRTACNNLSQ